MTMGQRIAEERKKLGLSQEALGDKLGVSRQAISKWESDAAVPDVDKLIALSKLFGVTVGWLLGVEEEPGGSEEGGFTEAQLKMVEQIVRRYQPKEPAPEQKPKRTWLKITAGAVALIAALGVLSNFEERLSANTAGLSGLNSTLYNIQNQLGDVTGRLEELAQGEKLLSDYQVEKAQAWDDGTGADITFVLVPNSRQDGESAYVAVRQADNETQRFECEWDGSVYTATVSVAALDGYEYYFVAETYAGTQQQRLEHTGVEDVASCLKIHCGAWCVSWIQNGKLGITNYSIELSSPKISRSGDVYLQNVEWIISFNEQELHREELLWKGDVDITTYTSAAGTADVRVELPKPEEGDRVIITVEVELSDGSKDTVPVTEFIYLGGQWTQTQFAPTDY